MIYITFIPLDISDEKSTRLRDFFLQVEAVASWWESTENQTESEKSKAIKPVPIGCITDVLGV